MRRSLAALAVLLVPLAVLAGCGNQAKPHAARNTEGMDPQQNAATATKFFRAVASNDPAKVTAAYGLAAPSSPARNYLDLFKQGLDTPAQPDTLKVGNGRYRICKADLPKSCHTYSAVVLSDGKVNDFTVDGKRIRLR